MQQEVTFNPTLDLKEFKTDTKKLIKVDKDNEMIKNLFVMQDEDQAMEEFEKEKD